MQILFYEEMAPTSGQLGSLSRFTVILIIHSLDPHLKSAISDSVGYILSIG